MYKLKLEFEISDKLINELRSDVSKHPGQEDQIIEDTLNESFDDIIDSDILLEEFKKLVKGDKVNFNERLMKCFSISPSFWSALNKEFKSYYNIELTNENGLVTIRNKNYNNEYVKFSYMDNGDETISIDIGKVEYDSLAVLVIFGNIYDSAINSGFKFVKITDNSNDKEFKKFSPEIIKYLKDNRMNMFSWK